MTYTEITSRKNSNIIFARSLSSEKKSRDESGMFALEGIKLLTEALEADLCVSSVYFTQKALDAYSDTLEKTYESGAQMFLVTDEVYSKLTDESAPQGIYACVKKPAFNKLNSEELSSGSFVFLESVQNPANIGAILRSCYALGFGKIILNKECSDIYSPKCLRAAMGSVFRIKSYFEEDIISIAGNISSCSNVRIFCTSLSEKSVKLGTISFNETDCFVIGNEGHGVSKEMFDACSHSLYIPMNIGAESLNAAAAAALVMWEMKKSTLLSQ